MPGLARHSHLRIHFILGNQSAEPLRCLSAVDAGEGAAFARTRRGTTLSRSTPRGQRARPALGYPWHPVHLLHRRVAWLHGASHAERDRHAQINLIAAPAWIADDTTAVRARAVNGLLRRARRRRSGSGTPLDRGKGKEAARNGAPPGRPLA